MFDKRGVGVSFTPPFANRPKSRSSRRVRYPAKGGGMQPRSTTLIGYENRTWVIKNTGQILAQSSTQTPIKTARLFDVASKSGKKVDYHPHSYKKSLDVYWSGGFVRDDGFTRDTYSPMILPSQFPGDRGELFDLGNTYDPSTTNRALSRFYDKLRDSKANLSIDLAEMSKTQAMIANLADRMVRIARQARRRGVKTFFSRPFKGDKQKRWDSIMSRTWLEYQYGWNPLLQTIFGLCEFNSNRAKRFRVEGSCKQISKGNLLEPPVSFPAFADFSYVRWNRVSIAKYSCDLSVADPTAFNLSRIASLNPVAIAWELVPYSFVVDWFIDIGGYLENLEQSFGLGLVFVRGYRTRVNVFSAVGLITPNSRLSINEFTDSGFTASTRRSQKDREILLALPSPDLPRFEVNLGWRRLLSAAALISTILTKVPHRT